MNRACQTITFGDEQNQPFPSIFDAIAAIGYEGVEIGFRHIEPIGPAGHMNDAKLGDVELPARPDDDTPELLVVQDLLRSISEGSRPQTDGQCGAVALATSLAAVEWSTRRRVVSLEEMRDRQPALMDVLG
jgi:hypothetical protein